MTPSYDMNWTDKQTVADEWYEKFRYNTEYRYEWVATRDGVEVGRGTRSVWAFSKDIIRQLIERWNSIGSMNSPYKNLKWQYTLLS